MSALIPPGAGQVVVGPITVDGPWITGPQGSIPTQGARVELINQTFRRTAIPTWAIVLAIVGFFIVTVLSLFFLLAKEERVEGALLVRAVAADGRVLEGHVPVTAATMNWVWSDLSARANAANRSIAMA